MTIFKRQSGDDDVLQKPDPRGESRSEPGAPAVRATGAARVTERGSPPLGESTLAAGLVIDGKIEGTGHVRLGGRFKGTVTVTGTVTVDRGAAIEGDVRADRVVVEGEVRGQVAAKGSVEVGESGALFGDLKAGGLTVAAGSKMRGKVEFGSEDVKS